MKKATTLFFILLILFARAQTGSYSEGATATFCKDYSYTKAIAGVKNELVYVMGSKSIMVYDANTLSLLHCADLKEDKKSGAYIGYERLYTIDDVVYLEIYESTKGYIAHYICQLGKDGAYEKGPAVLSLTKEEGAFGSNEIMAGELNARPSANLSGFFKNDDPEKPFVYSNISGNKKDKTTTIHLVYLDKNLAPVETRKLTLPFTPKYFNHVEYASDGDNVYLLTQVNNTRMECSPGDKSLSYFYLHKIGADGFEEVKLPVDGNKSLCDMKLYPSAEDGIKIVGAMRSFNNGKATLDGFFMEDLNGTDLTEAILMPFDETFSTGFIVMPNYYYLLVGIENIMPAGDDNYTIAFSAYTAYINPSAPLVYGTIGFNVINVYNGGSESAGIVRNPPNPVKGDHVLTFNKTSIIGYKGGMHFCIPKSSNYLFQDPETEYRLISINEDGRLTNSEINGINPEVAMNLKPLPYYVYENATYHTFYNTKSKSVTLNRVTVEYRHE